MRLSFSALRNWAVALCGAAALIFSAAAAADPPDRVARLTQIGGAVTFSPAGEDEWVNAEPNRPLTTGDRVWSDAGSHAELQIGTAAARMGENTSVAILNLDDRIGQFQLAQGTLNLRVRRIQGDQFYEIDTPTLAFSVRRDGDYRIDVDPSGNTTVIQVREGEGDAWGEGTAYTIDAGQQYTFTQGFQDVQYDALPQPDGFDRWCFDRNRREDSVASARYVSPDVIGYSDLDEYGTWRSVEGYGNVWVPTRVDPDWAPYHYGRWAWVDPWGWTWVDDQPWGFAPFHYGRWAYLSSRWCWVPGPVAVRAVYAPALVAFVGGGGFSISVGGGPVTGVAWFPLGVGDVYRPAYQVSQNYFTNINVSNTVINRTYVTNVYNNPSTEVRYRNRDVASAVTAVPTNVFASGERVDRHTVRVSREIVDQHPVAPVAAVAPTHAAVIAAGAAAAGAAVAAVHRPPREALQRQVVARTQPPPEPAPFAARQRLLNEHPGRPLEPEKARSVRAERPAEAPKVKVVAPNVAPRPVEKGMAKGGSAPGGPAAKGGPTAGGPTAQEGRGREAGPGPQAGQAPQPPAAAQERMRESERRAAQGAPTPPPAAKGGATAQEERAAKERRPAPGERVPQPPAQAQERMKGGPAGQAAQQERAQEQRAQQQRAQQQGAEQQRAQQERAQQQRAQQQGAEQQRAQQERAQQQRAPQERAAQERTQQQRAQQEQAQRAQQERAQQQRAQQERAQQDRAQQQRAQQERAAQERAQQQGAQQERVQQERAQQQRAQQERAQQSAQQQRAQQQSQQQRAEQQAMQGRAQQERAQQERAQQQRGQQERAQQQRAQEKDKEKEKEKERPSQQ